MKSFLKWAVFVYLLIFSLNFAYHAGSQMVYYDIADCTINGPIKWSDPASDLYLCLHESYRGFSWTK